MKLPKELEDLETSMVVCLPTEQIMQAMQEAIVRYIAKEQECAAVKRHGYDKHGIGDGILKDFNLK